MPNSPAYPGAPRWVKVAGLAALVLFLAFAALHLSGGHGPMHHLHAAAPAQPSSAQP